MHDDDRLPMTPARIDDEELARLIQTAGRRAQPPAQHYESVLAASRAAWERKVAARRRLRVYAAAASLAFVAAAAALLYGTLPPAAPVAVAHAAVVRGDVAIFSAEHGAWRPLTGPGVPVHAGDGIRTSGGGRASFTLANGTSLRLNVDTQVSVADADAIRLAGGAVYVDSDDGSAVDRGAGSAVDRHFGPASGTVRIETRFGTVRDVGTQFEVLSGDDALRLRVRSGSVEIRGPAAPGTVRGGAGEQVEISTAGTVQRRAFPKTHEEWRWVQEVAAPPELDEPTVLGYLRWVARETGRELRFDSDTTSRRAESARWLGRAEGLTPAEVLDAIAATTDFSYEITSDGSLLISRNAAR